MHLEPNFREHSRKMKEVLTKLRTIDFLFFSNFYIHKKHHILFILIT